MPKRGFARTRCTVTSMVDPVSHNKNRYLLVDGAVIVLDQGDLGGRDR